MSFLAAPRFVTRRAPEATAQRALEWRGALLDNDPVPLPAYRGGRGANEAQQDQKRREAPKGRDIMIGQEWRPAMIGNPDKRADARLQLHSALQWLARLANSYGEAVSSEHFDLTWDPARRAFITPELVGGLAVELRLPRLEMQFIERGVPSPHVLDVEGRSPAEIEAWILVELLHRGIDRSRFSKRLPYEAPTLMHGDANQFSPEGLEAELEELAVWLDNATMVLQRITDDLRAHGAQEPSAVRCWPDPFHLAVTLPLETGSASQALRVGLSVGDERHGEPHFFVIAERSRGASTMLPNAALTLGKIASGGMALGDVVQALEAQIESSRKKLSH